MEGLLDLQREGEGAGRGGHLAEDDMGASVALLAELEEVVTTI